MYILLYVCRTLLSGGGAGGRKLVASPVEDEPRVCSRSVYVACVYSIYILTFHCYRNTCLYVYEIYSRARRRASKYSYTYVYGKMLLGPWVHICFVCIQFTYVMYLIIWIIIMTVYLY